MFDFSDLFTNEPRFLRSEAEAQIRQAAAAFEAKKRGGRRKPVRQVAAEALAKTRQTVILGKYAF